MKNLSWQIMLGAIVTVATIVLLVFVARDEPARMEQTEAGQNALAIETGADLYEVHCGSCHGTRGEGIEKMGPPLNDEHFFTERLAEIGWTGSLDEYIRTTINAGRLVASDPEYKHAGGKGKPVMIAWAKENGGLLQPEEVQDLTHVAATVPLIPFMVTIQAIELRHADQILVNTTIYRLDMELTTEIC